MKVLRNWKKVFETDLDYIVTELKTVVQVPAVIILTGSVGAGKTTFVKSFFKIDKTPTPSPTYSLVHEIGDGAHADFYRLKSVDEITHLELSLYLEEKNYFLIEWGREYLAAIKKELAEGHRLYELTISVPKVEGDQGMRDYCLSEID